MLCENVLFPTPIIQIDIIYLIPLNRYICYYVTETGRMEIQKLRKNKRYFKNCCLKSKLDFHAVEKGHWQDFNNFNFFASIIINLQQRPF